LPESATWRGLDLAEHIRLIGGRVLRVVESQEQVATTHIVDSIEEQGLLEDMLERAKPAMRPGSEELHYLLMTPFRYPPLCHGSRFGQRHEPSIFYGSQTPGTALAETAYYRLVFWSGMEAAPPRPIRTQHTLFGADYRTGKGLKLHQSPFDRHHAILTHPVHYSETQTLGTTMREAGVLGFEFHSARDPLGGINIGLFEPAALASTQISHQEEWLCEVDSKSARFLHLSKHTIQSFPIDTFLIDGQLPQPAP